MNRMTREEFLKKLQAELGIQVIVTDTKPQGCDLCGEVKELRPYGPNGEWVCFPCGMKDEAAALRQFNKRYEEPKP